MEHVATPLAPANASACRILACSGSLDGGGSERQLWQLVSQLDRRRFTPALYLLARRGPYLDQLPSDVAIHAFGERYPSPPSFPPMRISWLQSRHLRGVIDQQRIDVVYDRTYHMTLLTGTLPRSVPRVSVVVSPPSRDLPQCERRFVWLKRRLLARAYRRADRAICVSEEVAEDAARYYQVPRAHWTVIPNPIDIETVQQLSRSPLPERTLHVFNQSSKQTTDASTQPLNIALIGRMTAEKGHAFALQLVWTIHQQRLTGGMCVHLHLVGTGPLEAELRRACMRQNIERYVHFHGYQINPYPFIAACDCVLITSRYEGFPNVALEAMALGKPLLMTNYGATALYLCGTNSQRAELIELENVPAAAKALLASATHPDRWLERADLARRWVTTHHALAPWLEQMMQLLEQVAGRRRQS